MHQKFLTLLYQTKKLLLSIQIHKNSIISIKIPLKIVKTRPNWQNQPNPIICTIALPAVIPL